MPLCLLNVCFQSLLYFAGRGGCTTSRVAFYKCRDTFISINIQRWQYFRRALPPRAKSAHQARCTHAERIFQFDSGIITTFGAFRFPILQILHMSYIFSVFTHFLIFAWVLFVWLLCVCGATSMVFLVGHILHTKENIEKHEQDLLWCVLGFTDTLLTPFLIQYSYAGNMCCSTIGTCASDGYDAGDCFDATRSQIVRLDLTLNLGNGWIMVYQSNLLGDNGMINSTSLFQCRTI